MAVREEHDAVAAPSDIRLRRRQAPFIPLNGAREHLRDVAQNDDGIYSRQKLPVAYIARGDVPLTNFVMEKILP